MIIDGTNLILGRLASAAAKKSLSGEDIIIVNCEKILITGTKKDILSKYKKRQERGDPIKGPFFPKMADRIVRRTIRSMLPFKKPKGRKAFKKVMCYIGTPKKYENQKLETINKASAKELKRYKYIKIDDIVKELR